MIDVDDYLKRNPGAFKINRKGIETIRQGDLVRLLFSCTKMVSEPLWVMVTTVIPHGFYSGVVSQAPVRSVKVYQNEQVVFKRSDIMDILKQ